MPLHVDNLIITQFVIKDTMFHFSLSHRNKISAKQCILLMRHTGHCLHNSLMLYTLLTWSLFYFSDCSSGSCFAACRNISCSLLTSSSFQHTPEPLSGSPVSDASFLFGISTSWDGMWFSSEIYDYDIIGLWFVWRSESEKILALLGDIYSDTVHQYCCYCLLGHGLCLASLLPNL